MTPTIDVHTYTMQFRDAKLIRYIVGYEHIDDFMEMWEASGYTMIRLETSTTLQLDDNLPGSWVGVLLHILLTQPFSWKDTAMTDFLMSRYFREEQGQDNEDLQMY